MSKVTRPMTIAPADLFRDDRINPLLREVGIKTEGEFHARLEADLKEIPEVKKLCDVADRNGCIGVLSGGTASMVIGELIQSWASGGSMRRLNDLASDIDGLLMGVEEKLTPEDIDRITAELNGVDGTLVDKSVPSSLRRKMILEWDMARSADFADNVVLHGGDPTSQIGIGLHKGKLHLFDPRGGLEDFFHGELNYNLTEEPPTDSEYYKQLHYDPSLEGLRFIRMIGRFEAWGLKPDDDTYNLLNKMGTDAYDQRRVSKALMNEPDDKGDFKLRRRWNKYLNRVWSDATDIGSALALLDATKFTDTLRYLGLGDGILQPLADNTIDSDHADDLGTRQAGGVRANNPVVSGADLPAQYLWLSTRMLEQFQDGAVYGKSGGDFGAGLNTVASPLEGQGYGAILTQVKLNPDARFLDMRTDFGKELEAGVAASKGLNSMSVAERINITAKELGVAGVIHDEPARVVVHSQAGIEKFTQVTFDGQSVIDELTGRKPLSEKKTTLCVRSLVALEREQGLARIADAIVSGKLPLQRFLFADVVDVLLEVPVRSEELTEALRARASDAMALGATNQVELYRLLAGLVAPYKPPTAADKAEAETIRADAAKVDEAKQETGVPPEEAK